MSGTPQAAALPVHDAPKQPAVAVLTALGVVYGDIGTSTLYGLKQAIHAGGEPTPDTVMGIVSLIIWALILIVSLKYAILVLRADNHGEGGIVALLALLDVRHAPRGSWRASLLVVGLIGAALLYGDGVITPAISVLSAVEGLQIDAPGLTPTDRSHHHRDPGRPVSRPAQGNRVLGGIFGPVMLVWFVAIALLGVSGIVRSPAILGALSPHHAVAYLAHAGPGIGFAVLGAAFLVLTGAEAMYADMGHFGRRPVQLGWFAIVAPALMLNYLGQGGLVLADARAAENPFFLLAPRWAHYPLVAFATLATVIASQAIISGAYSLTQQAMQLGFLPRMRVRHTASHEKGQIYIPVVNWLLAAGTLVAVLAFGSSDALGGAYGIAVSLLMAVTTVLAALVALKWGYNPVMVVAVNGFFLVIELVFIAANMMKLVEGGWFPLLMAGVVAFLMLTWRAGWRLLEQEARSCASARRISSPGCWKIRRSGCRARRRCSRRRAPAFRSASPHHLRHNKVLHERVLLARLRQRRRAARRAGRAHHAGAGRRRHTRVISVSASWKRPT
jgi:K+ transporter